MAGAPNYHTEEEWNALFRRLERVERAIQSIPYITADQFSELKKLIECDKTHSDELPPIDWGNAHPENLPPINWGDAHPELLPPIIDNGPQLSDSIADRLSNVERAVDRLKRELEDVHDIVKLCLKTNIR